MSKAQRLKSFCEGILILLVAALLFTAPEDEAGYLLVTLILSVSLILAGVRMLIYYFSMARHMVGGKAVLFRGVILFDLGMFTHSLANVPRIYLMLYLLIIHLFAGLIDVLRAFEAKKQGGAWRGTLAVGIANVLVGAACVAFARSVQSLVWIYSGGLIYTACIRIVSAFRRDAIVYIQ